MYNTAYNHESLSHLARLAWRQSAEETFSQATPFVSVTNPHSGCYQLHHLSPQHPLVTPSLDLPSQRLIAPFPPLLSSATQRCSELPHPSSIRLPETVGCLQDITLGREKPATEEIPALDGWDRQHQNIQSEVGFSRFDKSTLQNCLQHGSAKAVHY